MLLFYWSIIFNSIRDTARVICSSAMQRCERSNKFGRNLRMGREEMLETLHPPTPCIRGFNPLLPLELQRAACSPHIQVDL